MIIIYAADVKCDVIRTGLSLFIYFKSVKSIKDILIYFIRIRELCVALIELICRTASFTEGGEAAVGGLYGPHCYAKQSKMAVYCANPNPNPLRR